MSTSHANAEINNTGNSNGSGVGGVGGATQGEGESSDEEFVTVRGDFAPVELSLEAIPQPKVPPEEETQGEPWEWPRGIDESSMLEELMESDME